MNTDARDAVARMTERMIHRGPDSSGIWSDPERGVVLGHRRLAIVDLREVAKQPMSFADGRFHITFNGEIYNFRDLRLDLEDRGHQFISSSDTEVLLAAVAEWGLHPAIQRLVGPFAFALWDRSNEVLHLARDRMGEKPLHFSVIGGQLYFASEVRVFGEIRGFSGRISQDAVGSYLRFGYVPEPLSIYDNVFKLPPGTTLSVPARRDVTLGTDIYQWTMLAEGDLRKVAPVRYWSCEDAAKVGRHNLLVDPNEASAQFEAKLRETIREQMLCDVAIGCFLSGGIDSSLVAAVMQAESGSPIHTFTVAFDRPAFDESAQARAIAAYLGTRHEEFVLSERDLTNHIPSQIALLDEPTANGSFFAVYEISKLARTRATVVLSGDGGDELFAGYNRYALTARTWAMLRLLPRAVRSAIQKGLGSLDHRRLSERRGGILSLFPFGSQASVGSLLAKAERLLEAGNVSELYDLVTSCWPASSNLVTKGRRQRIWADLPGISAMLLSDQLDYLPGDSLAKVDRASMAVSLETRLPLLDHRLVEFSWRVPDHMKLQGNKSKWLMRSVLDRFLPPQLTDRKKMGFTVPIDHWLTASLRDWAQSSLESMEFRDLMGEKHGAILDTWAGYQSSRRPAGYQIWALVILAAWVASNPLAAVYIPRGSSWPAPGFTAT